MRCRGIHISVLFASRGAVEPQHSETTAEHVRREAVDEGAYGADDIARREAQLGRAEGGERRVCSARTSPQNGRQVSDHLPPNPSYRIVIPIIDFECQQCRCLHSLEICSETDSSDIISSPSQDDRFAKNTSK